MVGEQVGQYRVGDLIGRGGMGTVYRASDEMLGREVALKILDTDPSVSSERFRTEALALARLSHPGIAVVYQLLQHDDRLVMAMELVRGQTLRQIVDQAGVMSPERAAEICVQILGALAHAHSAGIVHRDLKPANLMITDTGTVKIMDFGVARLDGAAHLTQAGFTMGTPAYMAPEQLQGGTIDARTDLYALGVVFYRLITGSLPFGGATPFDMAQSQLKDPPTSITQFRADAPAWVSQVIARALAKNPNERFQSAQEFQTTLTECLAGRPLPSAYRGDGATEQVALYSPKPPAAAGPAATGLRFQRHIWLAAASAAAVAIVGIAWALSGPGIAAPPPSQVSNQPAPEGPARINAAITQTAAPAAGAARPPVPAVKPKASPVAPAPLRVSAASAPTSFGRVKLLMVDGKRATERDVVLLFDSERVAALPADRGDPLLTMPYSGIAKATYTYAVDPAWDSQLAAPAERINVPGFLQRSRHWLVLQTKTVVAILRLENQQLREVMATVESRAGVPITRVSGGDKAGR